LEVDPDSRLRQTSHLKPVSHWVYTSTQQGFEECAPGQWERQSGSGVKTMEPSSAESRARKHTHTILVKEGQTSKLWQAVSGRVCVFSSRLGVLLGMEFGTEVGPLLTSWNESVEFWRNNIMATFYICGERRMNAGVLSSIHHHIHREPVCLSV
jgi:hypothetical protein